MEDAPAPTPDLTAAARKYLAVAVLNTGLDALIVRTVRKQLRLQGRVDFLEHCFQQLLTLDRVLKSYESQGFERLQDAVLENEERLGSVATKQAVMLLGVFWDWRQKRRVIRDGVQRWDRDPAKHGPSANDKGDSPLN